MALTKDPDSMISGLDKSDVGLANVDNTADANKPVSTPQQTALDLKANIASPTFTGTVGGITKAMVGLSNVDNTADSAKPISTAQQTALDLKAPLASPTFTGTVGGVTKSMVGLGNVDNTSDATKNAAAVTLTNKKLQDSTTTIIDETDATKAVAFAVELVPTATTNVLTAPPISGVLVTDPTAATSVVPTLDLDFRNLMGAPFVGNLTRATVGGYRLNNKGIIVPTVVNEPVIDFGSDGKPLGTGFWGAYTNLILRSEEFDNASWSKTNVTVTANSIVGPDGATTMDTLDATNSSNSNVNQSVSMSAGSTVIHTCSVILKQGTAATTIVGINFITGGTGNSVNASINWSNLNVAVSGGANDKSATLESLGNGFYRFNVSGSNSGGANTNAQAVIYPGANTGTGTVYAWGAQLTATAFPVPYVPTTSAAVARNADSMLISGTDFTDFFNAVEGTFFVDFVNIRPNRHLFHVTRGAGTYGPRIQHIININTFSSLAVYDDANTLVGYAETINSGVSTGKSAVSYKLNEFKISVNGSAVIQDTAGALPTGLTRLEIARSPNQDVTLDGYIRRLTYFPKALDAATLQRMTA